MSARIFRPAKSAMSSGQAKTREWVLEYVNNVGRDVDPLMGWTSSSSTLTKMEPRPGFQRSSQKMSR